MPVLGGRFLELAGTDVVSDSQPAAMEKSGNNRLGNVLLPVVPDSIILAGEFCHCEESALGTASPLPLTLFTGEGLPLNFSQCVEGGDGGHGHEKASKRPTSLQAMSPALERKHPAPPPDLTRSKM